MANLIFSYLNKNKPRSILSYINFFFFFLLQSNPNNVTMHVVPTHVSNHKVSQTRWPGSRAGSSNALDFPFPIPRSRLRYFLHGRSFHGQKLEQLEPLSGLGDH